MGILLALTSAIVWGTGDFAGGFATRRGGQFQVLALSALSGIVLLVVLAWATGEAPPSLASSGWAASAGLVGAVGLACLYRGLAIGNAATVAPTAAVVTATLPVVFASLTAGLPKATQIAGFALALAGIWLVARTTSSSRSGESGLKLAIIAGCGFGAFLTLIAQVEPGLVFGPLAVARSLTLVTACLATVVSRQSFPGLFSNPVALLAGMFDAGGNIFYLLARQHTRLDVAAVLSSLYPAATVVLARVISSEPVTRMQWFGAAVCLAAIGLITA